MERLSDSTSSLLEAPIGLMLREKVFSGYEETIEDQLSRYARATWRGIERMSNTRTGLIDDRISINGRDKLSGETSLTNIGLNLACVIAAGELDLMEKSNARKIVEDSVSTIQSLPRTEKGFFYTWYDTESGDGLLASKKTGAPVPLVSSVDTAWLIAGLMTASKAYPELEERVGKIIDSLDIPFLYDDEKGLFYGVYDGKGEKPEGFHYDLLASEARMMTYIGISKYGIPQKAFFKLGREGVGNGRTVSGEKHKILSWEAGALEVLAPRLFVPEGEWSGFGLGRLQQRFTDRMVWDNPQTGDGGYFSPCEEPDGTYRVHGIKKFCLSREVSGGSSETPVAAFLGLDIRPVEITGFLSQIEKEIPGVYSEDLGFTASFNRGTRIAAGSVLGCDIGMNFLAVANLLTGYKIQEFFSRQAEPTIKPLLASELYLD